VHATGVVYVNCPQDGTALRISDTVEQVTGSIERRVGRCTTCGERWVVTLTVRTVPPGWKQRAQRWSP